MTEAERVELEGMRAREATLTTELQAQDAALAAQREALEQQVADRARLEANFNAMRSQVVDNMWQDMGPLWNCSALLSWLDWSCWHACNDQACCPLKSKYASSIYWCRHSFAIITVRCMHGRAPVSMFVLYYTTYASTVL